MTASSSWTGERIAWAVFLAAGGPLTLVTLAAADLCAPRWQARLARWDASALSRALSCPVLAGALALAWVLRLGGGRASLRYWWGVGLCVAAAGLAVAVAGAWGRAQFAPPPPPEEEESEAEAREA